jgi:hypothetical protein
MTEQHHDDLTEPAPGTRQDEPAAKPVHLDLDALEPDGGITVDGPGCALELPYDQRRTAARYTSVSGLDAKTRRLLLRHYGLDGAASVALSAARFAGLATSPFAAMAKAAAPMPALQAAVDSITRPITQIAAATVASVVPAWPAATIADHAMGWNPVVPAIAPLAAQYRWLAHAVVPMPTMAEFMPEFAAFQMFSRRNYLNLLGQTQAFVPLPDALGNLFQTWWRIAGEDGPDQPLAVRAYDAALQVRETILRDPDSRRAVIEFGHRWLGFKRMPDSRVDATVAALLDDVWIGEPGGVDFTDAMRQRVNREHERHRPIGERQLRRHHIVSLYEPVGWNAGTGTPLTILDLTPSGDLVEQVILDGEDGWHDHRIERALARLRPEERAVAEAWARGGSDTTWTLAAHQIGRNEKFGIRVRRKLERVGQQMTDRTAAERAR